MTTDIPNNNNDNQNLNHGSYTSNVVESPKIGDEADLLDIKSYVDGVVDFINHADTPLSIAINGEWGSGKTSIINTIKRKLCDDECAKYHGIMINTWQFSLLDSNKYPQAVVRILQSIVNQIMVLHPDYSRREKISQLIGSIATISSGLKSVADFAGDPLFGVSKTTLVFFEKISNKIKRFFGGKIDTSSTDDAALVKQLSKEIEQLVDEILNKSDTIKVRDRCVQKYEPYNPFDFSKLSLWLCDKIIICLYLIFCNFFTMCGFVVYYSLLMISDGLGSICTYSYFSVKAILAFICYIPKIAYIILFDKEWPTNNTKDGFIFFIDDLDRIDPRMALDIIETLESVFSFKKCIFILAIDKEVLIKSAELKLKECNIINCKDNERQIKEKCQGYLNRFVHMSIDVPEEYYNINILLHKSLQKISFFSVEELNDDNVINFLNNTSYCFFYKNPRAIKQLINQLSMLDALRRHAWLSNIEDKSKPGQIDIIIKEIVFTVQCIKIVYPDLFLAFMVCPYFKDWDTTFAKQFHKPNITKVDLERIIAEYDIDEWMYALFCICEFDRDSIQQFYFTRETFVQIEKIINNYIANNSLSNSKKSDKHVYEEIVTMVYALFYRKSGVRKKYDQSHYESFIDSFLKSRTRN